MCCGHVLATVRYYKPWKCLIPGRKEKNLLSGKKKKKVVLLYLEINMNYLFSGMLEIMHSVC